MSVVSLLKTILSHVLLMIHLMLIDGWRTEDGEDDNSEYEPEQEPPWGEKMSMKQFYIHNSTYIRDNRNDRFTQFLLLCFDDSLIPGSGFRLKKEVTEGNSEDSSEGDPEENTAGEQPWWGTKR